MLKGRCILRAGVLFAFLASSMVAVFPYAGGARKLYAGNSKLSESRFSIFIRVRRSEGDDTVYERALMSLNKLAPNERRELVRAALQHNYPDIVMGALLLFLPQGSVVPQPTDIIGDLREDIRPILQHHSAIFRRAALMALDSYKDKSAEDVVAIVRMLHDPDLSTAGVALNVVGRLRGDLRVPWALLRKLASLQDELRVLKQRKRRFDIARKIERLEMHSNICTLALKRMTGKDDWGTNAWIEWYGRITDSKEEVLRWNKEESRFDILRE